MHVEQVCFDRVFDVQAMNGLFSFESGGQLRYGISLPDEAVPADGEWLTIVFAEEGNWSSVLGWHDPATGKMGLRERTWALAWDAAQALGFLGALVLTATGAEAGMPVVLPSMLIGLCGIVFVLIRGLRRNGQVRRILGGHPV